MAESNKESAGKSGRRLASTQEEGRDEEAGEGLEQPPTRVPAEQPAPQAPQPDQCKKDKGGIVH